MESLKTCDMIFSTDMYYPGSVKSMERRRKGIRDKLGTNPETRMLERIFIK